jgi:acyl-coenzyme A thioesterase PaaI-like protein
MGESLKTRIMRWGFNLFPALRRTGGRVTYISSDLKQVRIKIPLSWKTRNYVGTIYGGSMYGAVDPIYMVMFIKLLGPGYIVWDKSANIQYKRPGRSTLQAEFVIDDDELDFIRNKLDTDGKTDRSYQIELRDRDNNVCALIEKTLHFKKKS